MFWPSSNMWATNKPCSTVIIIKTYSMLYKSCSKNVITFRNLHEINNCKNKIIIYVYPYIIINSCTLFTNHNFLEGVKNIRILIYPLRQQLIQ